MNDLLGSPTFNLHRTIPLNPLVPDAADPAITNPAIREARGFTHASIYWAVSGGAAASDDDTITIRIIGFDEFQQVWTRIRTVTLRVQERVIVPLLGQRLFVRVDAEATTATQAQIFVCGYTGAVQPESDYVTLPEQPATFAPGGATGQPDTGWLFTRDVAGFTELFYEDSAGNVTQLTGAGAAGGLQAAYEIDDSIVTTAAAGYVEIDRGAPSAAGEGALILRDIAGAPARTVPLLDINDQNAVAAGAPATVRILRNNVTNAPPHLTLESTDGGALGPTLRIFHNSASPANNDVVGVVAFSGNDLTPTPVIAVQLDGRSSDVTAGLGDGTFDIRVRRGGTLSRVAQINAVVGGADTGLRIINASAAGANAAFEFWGTGGWGAGQRVFGFMVGGGGDVLSINGNGAVVHAAGAVGTPSVTTTGDLDTGMWFPGANQAAISTGGNQTASFANSALTLLSNNSGAGGFSLTLEQASSTPADNDVVAALLITGRDSGGNPTIFVDFDFIATIVNNGTETGVVDLFVFTSGTFGRAARFGGSTNAAQQGLVIENFLAAGATNRQLELRLTEASATVGPILSLFRNRATDASDADAIGRIDFDGMDDGTPSRDSYARIAAFILDSGSASEDGAIDLSFVNGGTMGRAARYSSMTSVAAADTGLLQESFLAAGTTTGAGGGTANIHHEWLLTDATATMGPILSLNRFSSSPAANDEIGGIIWKGQDTGPATVIYGRFFMRIEDATSGTADSRFIWYTLEASTTNEAMRLLSTGQIEADLGAGAGNVTVFDDYDDAMVLREMFPATRERKQEILDRLVEMGICSTKDTGSGYMVNFQKMFALLGGGIAQTRERLDSKLEELANENAMLKARIIALEAQRN